MASSSLLRSAATAAAPRGDFFSSPSCDHSKVRVTTFLNLTDDTSLSMFSFDSDSARFDFALA
ncbi:hypothetical protein DY000_02062138 [Brassica cretica]|uniref:Uncharacterized protein n=1 Tax=Brassica cretica TaxID=69181 RepID=A0ABQ7B1Z2_BRACR|nr:hypothetical protein DY000_02062138 [Brassica cretica]